MGVPRVDLLSAGDLPRWLDSLSLLHVSRGAAVAALSDGERARIRRGDLLAVRAGGVELRPARSDFEALWLRMDPRLGGAASEPAVRNASQDGELDVGLCPSGDGIAVRVGRLLAEARLDSPHRGGDGSVRDARCFELVEIALELRGSLLAPRPRAVSGSRHRADLLRALEELDSTGLEDASLARLAARVRLSQRQVSRLFQQELGTSFRDYLTSLRLERAKKQLATEDAPIVQVALETGWSSVSHFNTVFRRHVGVTPSRYRAETRQGI